MLQLRALADAFERLGYDVDRLLGEIGFCRSDLADPDRLVPLQVIDGLVERTQRERPLRNLWLRLGAETPMGAYQVLDYLIVTADTVGDGIRQLARYVRFGAPWFVIEIHDDEEPIRLEMRVVPPGVPTSVEYGVARVVCGMRAETDDRVRFEWVNLAHEPDDVAEMTRVLGCPVRPGAAWTGTALSRDAWKVPLRRRDPILRNILESASRTALPRLSAADGTPLDVRRVLPSRLARGETEIDHVARALGTSVRTLQRRLSSAGLSYHGLLDVVRREIAERSLADSSLSIGEVAYLVGYSEPAAFHHAFKRWTGLTPQAFRQRPRDGLPAARS
jgi:AraC-like DNA-binding protein